MRRQEEIAGGSPGVLRMLNTRMVLRAVREHGPISRSALISRTGLSRPTITEVVEHLFDRGLVADDEQARRSAGRTGPPARLLRFRAEAGRLVGVDVGAETILVQVAMLDGTVLGTHRAASRTGQGRTALVGQIRTSIDTALRASGAGEPDVAYVAVSTPGTVDPHTGTVQLAPQLPAWDGTNVAEALALPWPTAVENEMHAAVLGEQWRGAARDSDDVVYVGAGVGVGAGIIVHGQLLRGVSGAAGEIGYLPLADLSGAAAGKPGSLEAVAGSRAFAAHGRELARTAAGARLRELAGAPDLVDAPTIFAAAADGDLAATALVADLAAVLARGIASLALVVDPAIIVLGGGMSRAGETLLAPVRDQLQRLVPATRPALVLSELGDEAAVTGALRLALELHDEQVFSVNNAR